TPQVEPVADQSYAQPDDSFFSATELDNLVAPIALYPDALLAQVLPASAYPVDIVQAQRWIDKNKASVAKQDFSGIDGQSWDPAVKALVRFPDVVKKLNDDLDWTTDLGDAFINQPKDVADAIQRMRARADATGALKPSQQQKVVKRKESNRDVIVIESASPEVIYVPVYDPVQVYDPAASAVAASLLTFGTAVAIGASWNNNNYWNWGSGIVYPPVWPGYPAWRPPYSGWRPGMPAYPPGVRPPGNINIGNDVNIGNVNIGNSANIGNNVRPWRPDSDRYRPGQGSKPGLRLENSPGARSAQQPASRLEVPAGLRPDQRPETRPASRPEVPAGLRPDQRPETRPASRPEVPAGPRPEQPPEVPAGLRPEQRPETRPASRPEVPAGLRPEQRPETRPASRPEVPAGPRPEQRPETRPASRPEMPAGLRPEQRPETRPAPLPETRPGPRPSQAKPGGAFGGIDGGRGAAQTFSNRGGQSFSSGPAMGARPAAAARPVGGGGGRGGGLGGGGGGRRL
ncbi:MAG: DUF3300 domain-containing protein, partial [Hyphomicrobiales bacterium]|nr:DUF3300 domain-containing protein [Hyphomicrobiales bacterium]